MQTDTQLPIKQLRPPEEDVRTHRPPERLRSLANSMGDPAIGQLQPIVAYPVGWEDLEIDSKDDLDQLIRDSHEFVVVDGYSRFLAARDHLKWDRIWTIIWDSPPENLTIARLDANTERITMSEFETVRAVVKHKQDTGKTWQEVSEETGWSPSYLAHLGRIMNGPEWLVEAWQDPECNVETSHVTRIDKGIGKTFQEQIQELGDKSEDEARALAHRMGQNFIEWTDKYEYSPADLERSIKAKQDEILRDLQDGRTLEEKQRAREREKATSQDGVDIQANQQPETCVICDTKATTMVAIPVCDEDRGMLNDHRKDGKSLLKPQGEPEEPQGPPGDVQPEEAIEALVKYGADPEALHAVLGAKADGEIH